MHFSLPVLLAFAMSQTANARAVAVENSPIPDLPNGFFSGHNNPDGTNTLHFHDTDETFTFMPRAAEAEEPLDLTKRQGDFWPARAFCWNPPTLNRDGTDESIRQMRSHIRRDGNISVGQYSNWAPYFGYNANGVYTYFCVNSGSSGSYRSFNMGDLDWATSYMDSQCGAYMPGYVRFNQDPDKLFGKCVSGTPVCQGNPRSPK
jgi:hypothetical protein